MQRYVFILIAVLSMIIIICELTFHQRVTGNSYFNDRKKALEDANITLHPQPKWSKVDKRYYEMTQRNTHDYKRLINQPNLCSNHEKVFLLIAIRTIYSHTLRREILREQYNHTLYINYAENMVVKYIFLFGRTNDSATEKLIRKESEEYNDIIQEDFVESYVNVSLKAIMAWKWALEFCPNTQYVMVENDEAYVDLDKLVVFLLKDLSMGKTDDHFAVCNKVGNSRSDHLNHRKFTSLSKDQVYQGNYSPSYCHGVVYAAHIDTINKLYKASFTNKPFMPTDLWIGIMSEKLRLDIPKLNHLYIAPRSKHVYSDVTYQIKDAMIVITDWDKNNDKDVPLMRNIHSKIKTYWRQVGRKRTVFISEYKFMDIYVFSRKYIAIALTIALIVLFCRHILFKFMYKYIYS